MKFLSLCLLLRFWFAKKIDINLNVSLLKSSLDFSPSCANVSCNDEFVKRICFNETKLHVTGCLERRQFLFQFREKKFEFIDFHVNSKQTYLGLCVLLEFHWICYKSFIFSKCSPFLDQILCHTENSIFLYSTRGNKFKCFENFNVDHEFFCKNKASVFRLTTDPKSQNIEICLFYETEKQYKCTSGRKYILQFTGDLVDVEYSCRETNEILPEGGSGIDSTL